jgi:serine/threonine-protein kinase
MQALRACCNCETAINGDALYGYCHVCLYRFGFVELQPPERKIAGMKLPLRFGGYDLIEEIGHGRHGVVFKAEQLNLNRTVAFKWLVRPRLESPAAWRGFVMEADAVSRLYHPNILRIYDVGEWKGQRFLTMPLVCGETLARKVARGEYQVPRGDRPSRSGPHRVEQQIAGLVATVARALDYAHERDVLHGDLRPHRILIDYRDRLYLTGFCFAKILDSEPACEHIETGMIDPPIGQDYLAPEQAPELPATRAGNIYSLGVILYGLLTGRLPFTGATAWAAWRKKMNEDPDSPRRHNPVIDEELATICLKCLRRDPARRYVKADELARDLEQGFGLGKAVAGGGHHDSSY